MVHLGLVRSGGLRAERGYHDALGVDAVLAQLPSREGRVEPPLEEVRHQLRAEAPGVAVLGTHPFNLESGDVRRMLQQAQVRDGAPVRQGEKSDRSVGGHADRTRDRSLVLDPKDAGEVAAPRLQLRSETLR